MATARGRAADPPAQLTARTSSTSTTSSDHRGSAEGLIRTERRLIDAEEVFASRSGDLCRFSPPAVLLVEHERGVADDLADRSRPGRDVRVHDR
jgi:hypothetical protein